MKMESKEIINGKTVITTSKRFLFWRIITRYEAQKEYPSGYWEWLKLPNHLMVDDMMGFQLNKWNKL